MKKYGFYCHMLGKDCFFETNQIKITKKLAKDFIYSVQYEKWNVHYPICNDADIEYIQNSMRRAIFELKTIQNGNFAGYRYYEINGENFSFGCDPCKDPMENCILICIKEG